MDKVRASALALIGRIIDKKEPAHKVLFNELVKFKDLPEQDRAFLKLLTFGTVQRMVTVDMILSCLCSKPINKIKNEVLNILRLGIFQIAFTDVPDHAAVYETVSLATKGGTKPLKPFINGVLREFTRQKDKLLNEYPGTLKEDEQMSFLYSAPLWLVRLLKREYGHDKTVLMLESFLKPSGLAVRVNLSLLKGQTLGELAKSLRNRNIIVNESPLCDNAFMLYNCPAPSSIEEFRNGILTVQDAGCALSGRMLSLKGNEKVLDLCAAPGGKSLNAADIMRVSGGKGSVTACDITEDKLELIRENIARCGFDNISVVLNDATVLNESFIDAFDTVICDLPCSGLGVMGRKVDIRYITSTDV